MCMCEGVDIYVRVWMYKYGCRDENVFVRTECVWEDENTCVWSVERRLSMFVLKNVS